MLIAIDGRVHDCVGWLKRHPGGAALLETYAGRDASDVFAAFHGPEVYKTLKAFDVGCIVDETIVEGGNGMGESMEVAFAKARRKETAAFRKLRDELWREGAFAPSAGAIAVTMTRLLVILALAMWFTLVNTESVMVTRAAGAIFLGLFWQQSLLMAHDLCHRCVTRNTRVDKRLAYIFGTLTGGVGVGWWNKEHCEHHAVTQVIDGDPSAGAHPVLCPHTSMMDKLGPALRYLVKFQALYYVPVCVFVGRVNLHIISILKAPSKDKLTDLCLMGGYAAYNACLLQAVEPGARVVYFVLSNTVCGILHLVLNMNHYPMPMLSFDTAMDLGFFRFQCVTTLNQDQRVDVLVLRRLGEPDRAPPLSVDAPALSTEDHRPGQETVRGTHRAVHRRQRVLRREQQCDEDAERRHEQHRRGAQPKGLARRHR